MRARLIAVGERMPGWVAEGFAEYRKRLSHELPLELIELKPGARGKGRDDARAIGVFLNGEEIPLLTPQGEPVVDDSFLLLFNGHYEPIEFKLPTKRFGTRWQFVLSTAEPEVVDGSRSYTARAAVPGESRSVLVLRRGW